MIKKSIRDQAQDMVEYHPNATTRQAYVTFIWFNSSSNFVQHSQS